MGRGALGSTTRPTGAKVGPSSMKVVRGAAHLPLRWRRLVFSSGCLSTFQVYMGAWQTKVPRLPHREEAPSSFSSSGCFPQAWILCAFQDTGVGTAGSPSSCPGLKAKLLPFLTTSQRDVSVLSLG